MERPLPPPGEARASPQVNALQQLNPPAAERLSEIPEIPRITRGGVGADEGVDTSLAECWIEVSSLARATRSLPPDDGCP